MCAVVVASGFVFTKGLAHCGCTLLLLSIFNLVLVNHVLIRIGCIIAFGVGSFGAHRTKTTLAGSEITLCATCSHKSAKDVSIECLRYCMPRLQNSDVSTTDTGNTWIFFPCLKEVCCIFAGQWELLAAFSPSSSIGEALQVV